MLRIRRSWVSAFGGLLLVALAGSAAGARGAEERGSVREVGGFDSVSFATNGKLVITQGDREGLEIEAAARELPRIVTQVRDGTLHIGRVGPGQILSLRPPVFRLTVKTIAALETHSSGKIVADDLRVDSLRIRVSSSGGISIDSLAADSLDVHITSSGSVRVAGSAARQDIRLSSSGSYLAGSLASRTARVTVSSSGTATLRVSESLEASVTSSGSVRYHGSPPRVSQNVTSSGRIVRLGD